MKKTIIRVLICAALTITFAGCGGNSGGSSSTSTSSTTSSQSSSTGSSSSVQDVLDAPNEGENNSSLVFPDNRAGRIARKALDTDVWPQMDVVTDKDMISSLFATAEGAAFDMNDISESVFCTNIISAQLYRIVVLKPQNGREGEVKDALDKYFAYIKDGAAFYPDQEECAAGAVSGKTDDGYIYLIVHKNGAAIEKAVKNA